MSAFGGQPKPQVIPCRQYCAICGNLYAVDYHVTNQEIWDEAIHPHYRNSTVCLECFIRRADEKRLLWDFHINFEPRSSRTMEDIQRAAKELREHIDAATETQELAQRLRLRADREATIADPTCRGVINMQVMNAAADAIESLQKKVCEQPYMYDPQEPRDVP